MKRSQRKRLKLTVFFAVVVSVAIVATVYLKRPANFDFVLIKNDQPVFSGSTEVEAVSKSSLRLRLTNSDAGVQSVSVALIKAGVSKVVMTKYYESRPQKIEEKLLLGSLGLQEGETFSIRVEASDGSIVSRKASKSYSFSYDNKDPRITVTSSPHNIAPGGATLVTYSLSEPVKSSGIMIGKEFFPGYLLGANKYGCLIAFPLGFPEKKFIPRVHAEDLAGNKSNVGIYYNIVNKRFRMDSISISQGFLDTQMPQYAEVFPKAKTNLELFLKINRELRKKNRAKLRADFQGPGSQSLPLWKEVFFRQSGANKAGFGEQRHYYFRGKKVDVQTHMGVDIASTARSELRSANRGQVVFADEFGIYGQCVIVDHGMGLQSLYGHMSEIKVKVGEVVERGQAIGRSGSTGMAAGDHLHFAMLVSGVPVNPLEWWDVSWLKNNIFNKLTENI